jgi:predicted ABC-type ATPase
VTAELRQLLGRRPIIVAIAGPNGAGKSTFHEAFLKPAALRFINADVLAGELPLDPYAAAQEPISCGRELVARRESFVFETVLSDPVGAKIEFLREAAADGYAVVMCFIGLESAAASDQRVAMRVSQGGHDVPPEKIAARYPRTLSNLRRAIAALPAVLIYDNSDLAAPFRLVGTSLNQQLSLVTAAPKWLRLRVK